LISRIPITDLSPAVNFGGELVPVKAVAGEVIAVTATIFREGHDALGAHTLLFDDKDREIARTPMREIWRGGDRFEGTITIPARGEFNYAIEAFDDPFATWEHDS
jgi:starch synthase (maltosyl-transferring)